MKYSILITVFFLAQIGHSQELDQYDQKALQQTMDLLKNQNEREKAIKGDAAAEKADAYAKDLFGNAGGSNELYELAADLFADMAKQSGGDVDKMKALVEQYQRDPAAFAEKWSPEQKQKLKGLSDKVKVPASNH